jgi:hypothetical protein
MNRYPSIVWSVGSNCHCEIAWCFVRVAW